MLKIDDGYVYVIDYRNQREELVKIGRSVDPESRFRAILGDVPRSARLRILYKARVFGPAKREAQIHAWFSEQRTRPRRVGAKAGGTEYFRLGRADKLKVITYLWILSVWRLIVLMGLFVLIISALVYILTDLFI